MGGVLVLDLLAGVLRFGAKARYRFHVCA